LPVDLVYSEEVSSLRAAVHREKQLKRWSAAKKAALIKGDLQRLRALSKRRRK
jgi:predicted GIY-YIG superfamily endonuclease